MGGPYINRHQFWFIHVSLVAHFILLISTLFHNTEDTFK